jgi:uncharacterized integral membrane protein
LANLEIQPDPVAVPSFGEGLVSRARPTKLPWPIIVGAILALILVVLLMTR